MNSEMEEWLFHEVSRLRTQVAGYQVALVVFAIFFAPAVLAGYMERLFLIRFDKTDSGCRSSVSRFD